MTKRFSTKEALAIDVKGAETNELSYIKSKLWDVKRRTNDDISKFIAVSNKIREIEKELSARKKA